MAALGGIRRCRTCPGHRYPHAPRQPVHFVGVVFEGTPVGQGGERDGEAVEVAWFPAGALPERLFAADRPGIADAVSARPRPFLR